MGTHGCRTQGYGGGLAATAGRTGQAGSGCSGWRTLPAVPRLVPQGSPQQPSEVPMVPGRLLLSVWVRSPGKGRHQEPLWEEQGLPAAHLIRLATMCKCGFMLADSWMIIDGDVTCFCS